jgi:integrase
MKKQDLQPNPKEIMETFVDDPIDRNKDLVRFIKIIDSINESYEDFIVPVSRKIVYDRFKKLIKKNDIDMTFHDLRHLNASIMLMLGVPDKYAMERGGWSTDSVLKSVYQQTFSSERKKIDSMIDSYFNSIISKSEDDPA